MKETGRFLKNFGLGLVYVLALPFWLAVLALFAVYGFLVFIVLFAKAANNFFHGRPFFHDKLIDDEIDARVKEVKEAIKSGLPPQTAGVPAGPATVYVQQNYYQNPSAKNVPPLDQMPPVDALGPGANQAIDAASSPIKIPVNAGFFPAGMDQGSGQGDSAKRIGPSQDGKELKP
jgi:hypothetical protein